MCQSIGIQSKKIKLKRQIKAFRQINPTHLLNGPVDIMTFFSFLFLKDLSYLVSMR